MAQQIQMNTYQTSSHLFGGDKTSSKVPMVLGIMGAAVLLVIATMVGAVAQIFWDYLDGAEAAATLGIIIILAVGGVISAYYADPKYKFCTIGSGVMILIGIITLLFLGAFGIISGVLFILGGVIAILQRKKIVEQYGS